MSRAETAAAPETDDLAGQVVLDVARPLRVSHLTPASRRLTLAVVSIGWLRGRSPQTLAALRARYLTPAEAERAFALHSPRRRHEWLAGRLALKHAVSAYGRRHWDLDREPGTIEVRTVTGGLQAGRPVVDAPVEVGLTHSGDFAVAVCGPHAIGVDLEHDRPMPPTLARLLDQECDPRAPTPDARRLAAMPAALRWTCKEAVLKYYGFGLRVDAREVALTGWLPDGRFTWRPGGGLLRHAPTAETRRPTGWAGAVHGHHLALVGR
ncbi:4'-phosphopantetheinyl transferase [Streptomyces sp. BK208]|uniref:4'-phosphopantetheinyl transferase family protein n=1 Tax=Streptomyces sp. BK208 TaxID=2512150 RepID=UPI00106072C6|nr:4'-phosphopantetheinyl transferase superfamily protein [Streptomyces sp. BK208]TDT28121.1 4'-phosphopantetheinyl transferase [Streptomyces sp. BK208]